MRTQVKVRYTEQIAEHRLVAGRVATDIDFQAAKRENPEATKVEMKAARVAATRVEMTEREKRRKKKKKKKRKSRKT